MPAQYLASSTILFSFLFCYKFLLMHVYVQDTAEAICRRIGVFGETESTVGLSYSGREFDDLSEAEQRDACRHARLALLFFSFLLTTNNRNSRFLTFFDPKPCCSTREILGIANFMEDRIVYSQKGTFSLGMTANLLCMTSVSFCTLNRYIKKKKP